MNQNAATGESKTSENLELLQKLKTEVCYDSDENLALALGRETEEIKRWFSGEEEIDEDAEIKIRALAQERLGE